MNIIQKNITLKPKKKGFHIITNDILNNFPEISKFKFGTINIFLKHTSAAITINENADPTVRNDLETFFNKLVPEIPNMFQHTAEGLDDMTSHITASIIGNTLTIPINNGKLSLGTWQGIYLCEFRNNKKPRNITINITGNYYD